MSPLVVPPREECQALEVWEGQREGLLRVIGRLAERATSRGDGKGSEQLEQTRARLSEGGFNLAVLGEFKRGKSTLINALLGAELMPVGVIPTTSIAITVQYGERALVEVEFQDGHKEQIDPSRLAEFATETSNPENRKGVRAISAYHPSAILGHGVRLVDTPGIGSVHRHNTVAAYDYLRHSDAAIFILSADNPASAAELEFLEAARGQFRRMLFVLNKADLLSASELGEAIGFVRLVLARATGDAPVALFAVSSRHRDQGFLYFAEALARLLAEEKGRFLLERADAVVAAALDRERQAVVLERRALQLSAEDAERRAALLQERLGEVRLQRDEAEAILASDLDRVVAQVLDPSVGSFRQRGEKWVAQLLAAEARAEGPDLFGRMQRAVAEGVGELVTSWLGDLERELGGSLGEVATRHRQRAQKLASEAVRLASELFEVELPELRLPTELGSAGERIIRLDDEALALELVASALKRMAPGRVGVGLATKAALARGEELVDRHCGRVHHDARSRIRAQEARWRNELRATLDGVEATVSKAVDMAVGARRRGAAAVEEAAACLRARELEIDELEVSAHS